MLLALCTLAFADPWRLPLPVGGGLFDVRFSWQLPAPVLMADGSLIRAHYAGSQFVVARYPIVADKPAWTWSQPAPVSVAAPVFVAPFTSPAAPADLQALGGAAPWLADADESRVRVFVGASGSSTAAVLDAKVGKMLQHSDEPNAGFAGVLTEPGGSFAQAWSHDGVLSVKAWDKTGKPLATLKGTVPAGPSLYVDAAWKEKGLQDSALGHDGSLLLAVGEGKGRLHLELWAPDGGTRKTPTLIDTMAEELLLRQTPSGGALVLLRESKGGLGQATVDLQACVALAGDTAPVCHALGLEALVGQKPGRWEVISALETAEGGFVLAVQANHDMVDRTITRIRGDVVLLGVAADGTLAWHQRVPYKASVVLSGTVDDLVAPAALVRDGTRTVFVTATSFGGMFDPHWRMEARALDAAGRPAEEAFAVHETDGVPLTDSLSCASARCAVTEQSRSGDTLTTVVFD